MTRKAEQITASRPQKIWELKKHVAVIHSSNKLSLLQRKIANALLYNAYSDLQVKEEHEIHIGKLCELIGYDSNDHKSIKRALVNLLSTVLEWNLVDGERLDKDGIWNASAIIADASIDGAMCTYSYSNKMRKLLYSPEIYGRLDMLVQAKFQSGYGLALYENCNRFQDIGQTPWFSLTKFRKLMGVEDSKYKIFRDFKNRVLDKAVAEVNQYSSLIISPQLRKQNRQVISIQFLIKKSNTIAIDHNSDESELANDTLSDLLKSRYGLSIKAVKEVIAQYEEKYIREKMYLVEVSPSFRNGKVNNVARYLLSALRDDYQLMKKSGEINNLPMGSSDKYAIDKKIREQQAKAIEFMRYQDKNLFALFKQLPVSEKNSIVKNFEKYLGTAIYRDILLRDGLENVLIQDQLCNYLRQINHTLLTKLPTKKYWLKSRVPDRTV